MSNFVELSLRGSLRTIAINVDAIIAVVEVNWWAELTVEGFSDVIKVDQSYNEVMQGIEEAKNE